MTQESADFDTRVDRLLDELARTLMGSRWKLATAESCTGGWIAKCCTDVPGSSEWFERGFVTYSNEAKVEMLRVAQPALDADGAVSSIVAEQMARGAAKSACVDASVAVTGIAGPDGGTLEKPVGTVWIAWFTPRQGVDSAMYRFDGDRARVRQASVVQALEGLLARLEPG